MNYPFILGCICLVVIWQLARKKKAWLTILLYWIVLCIKNFSEV